MTLLDLNQVRYQFDRRREIIVPGDFQQTLNFCVSHFIQAAQQAIKEKKTFFVALSGGSTPRAIYEKITSSPYREAIDWKKVYLFWSDERAVAFNHQDSNYHMAMEAGFHTLPIPTDHLYRMQAEEEIEKKALEYEAMILEKVPQAKFDLVLLGMGEDGHTASLFPHTAGIDMHNRLAIANYIPQKNTWRMTLTFECINQAKQTVIYVLGKEKAGMLEKVFTADYNPLVYPIQKIGTVEQPTTWILDQEAIKATPILQSLNKQVS